jgi:hypothetical protein
MTESPYPRCETNAQRSARGGARFTAGCGNRKYHAKSTKDREERNRCIPDCVSHLAHIEGPDFVDRWVHADEQ